MLFIRTEAAAIVDGGNSSEYNIQMADKEPITGNIYKGAVMKVERGLQAAFVITGAGGMDFCRCTTQSRVFHRADGKRRRHIESETFSEGGSGGAGSD